MSDTLVTTAPSGTATRPTREVVRRTDVTPAEPVLDPVIRPMRPGEARDVRRIFRATLLLGRPLPIEEPSAGLRYDGGGTLYAYESLCLDWYLTNGTVLVAEHEGRVRGYLLACLDQARYERWAEPRAVRWGARALAKVASGELRGDERRFVLLRVRDGLAARRSALPAPFPAHAHLNLDREVRDTFTGHRLAAAMDDLVREAGLAGWFGELNVPEGRSLDAIERAGAVVVHRVRNRTFSWLLGRPVDRATIARPLATRTESVQRPPAGPTRVAGVAPPDGATTATTAPATPA